MIPDINIQDYNYCLPDGRIAKYPLPQRDASKLLCYKDGEISEHIFTKLPDLLPQSALMVFNDTKVVPARLHFLRPTGAHIEIFCLEPVFPAEYSVNFATTSSCRWKCIVGNVKRWKSDILRLYNPGNWQDISDIDLQARLIERDGETSVVEFSWNGGASFASVLEKCGTIPIPPYLERESEELDKERYQTLYARFRGSVAAPTAGLHFTENVLSEIWHKGIVTANVCLHVGAGTFLPVKNENVSQHKMHREPFSISRVLIEMLKRRDKHVVAVGTTSVRTLESLYYAGVECIQSGHPFDVEQWMPYTLERDYALDEALDALIDYMTANKMEKLTLGTKIIIVPGYKFRLVDILVTNFHQPQSTLLLLISAFLDGNWREVYDYALTHDFRFLSYGDSSVLFGKNEKTF